MEHLELEERLAERLAALDRTVLQSGPGLTRAAVLVPILRAAGGPRLLLTRRTHTVPTHKGQVSFPGGKVDPGDRDLRDTALREAHEELGIAPDDVRVLGELHDRVTVTDFVVTPLVGAIDHPYPYRPAPREIDEVLEIPLEAFRARGVHRVDEDAVHRGRPYPVHYYDIDGTIVWGATAGFIHALLALST